MLKTRARRQGVRRHQQGLAVMTVIFLVIGLMALIATAMVGDGSGAGRQVSYKLAQEVTSQAQLLRMQITRCATEWPLGNNGTTFHVRYPGAATSVAVSTLTCPGAPAGSQALWSGKDAIFLPPPPDNFNAWAYVNDATSVRLILKGTNSTAVSALALAIAKFSSTEAGLSTTTLTNDTLTLTIIL